jgi:hypothetical protein
MASKKPPKPVPHNEPTPEERSMQDILAASKQMLTNAQMGLRNVKSADPTQRVPGLHNVIVFGRAVTIALQRLRSVVEGFDEWYGEALPAKDPLLIYMNRARNAILKQAETPRLSTHVVVRNFDGNPSRMFSGEPPQGATGVFVGDLLGGSGWLVRLPDGTQETYYAELSPFFEGTVTLHFQNGPTEFMGQPVTDSTVAGIASSYVAMLERVITEAEHRFSP